MAQVVAHIIGVVVVLYLYMASQCTIKLFFFNKKLKIVMCICIHPLYYQAHEKLWCNQLHYEVT